MKEKTGRGKEHDHTEEIRIRGGYISGGEITKRTNVRRKSNRKGKNNIVDTHGLRKNNQ